MTEKKRKKTGFVSLIGAGPGDPGLITAKGLDRLRRAQAVVFDALVNPRLLDEASPDARQIDVGKRGGDHKLTQDQTNRLLVDLAEDGLQVVRLKGGDPYLFGRGAEEATYLAKHGIRCEVIPGITSGIAAPMYAGVPVTHRKIASTVTFVTGHEDPTKPDTAVDYKSLAGLIKVGGTACFYMGIGQLPRIVSSLTTHGLSADTPSAVVQWGTRTRQRSVCGALESIEQLIKAQGIGAPAIILVGQVAGLKDPGLDFFTSRPLFGKRVLVTRTRQQASQLSAGLEEMGAEVYEAPTIRLVPPPGPDWREVDQVIQSIAGNSAGNSGGNSGGGGKSGGGYDWLILTSPNGVDALADRLASLGLDARHLSSVKVACVGDATVDTLTRRLSISPDFVPKRTMGEGLAEELIAGHELAGKKVLLLRADIARPALPRLLTEAGAQVRELAVYQTKIAEGLPEEVLTALRQGGIDWVTFTSGSTVKNLIELLGEDRALLDRLKTASIGPVTSEAMRQSGLDITVQARQPAIADLIDAVVKAV